MKYMLIHEIQNMANIKIPILIFTYSLSLFDIITRYPKTVEKTLMIDMLVVKYGAPTK